MIKIAIVEDNVQAEHILQEYLERYQNENKVMFEINSYNTLLSFKDCKEKFDLILMDIELPDGDGMEAIRYLRESDKQTTVIFVTNLAQYAVKGYEVKAFDFIVKPVSYGNFFVKIKSALESINKKRNVGVWITNKTFKTMIMSNDIIYIEVRQHTLIYHTKNADYTVTGQLLAVEKELEGLSFSLCNRCYLVNLKYVTSVDKSFVKLGNTILQISRQKHSSFVKDLNNYLATGD